jgi:hypothetical protein
MPLVKEVSKSGVKYAVWYSKTIEFVPVRHILNGNTNHDGVGVQPSFIMAKYITARHVGCEHLYGQEAVCRRVP